MAFSLNRVELIGRLGREPEMRYTATGQAVTTLSVATDRRAPAGEQPETDWHRVVCWDKLAEFAGQYLTTGRLIFIAGRLSYRSWETKDGQQRWTAEIVGSEIILLDRRPQPEPGESDQNRDDDVPF
jgi:single-strand DNA-binding protein